MLRQEQDIVKAASTYAVPSDFCRIFAEEMDRLYLLSFLLTGDGAKAEQCFVSSLEDCMAANQVFRDWARSWACRAIIHRAIRIMQPSSDQTEPSPIRGDLAIRTLAGTDGETPLAAVVGLHPFERFVFVLTVLEGYSDQDCRMLLQCSRRDIVRARSRAVVHIARSEGTLPLPLRSAGEAFAHPG